MSHSINEITLLGNVGAKPEIKSFGNNRKLAQVSLATTRSFKDASGAWQEKTDWHRIKVWGKAAETVEKYVNKGDKICFKAHLEYSQTGEGENRKFFTDIVSDRMILVSSNKTAKNEEQPVVAGVGAMAESEDEASDDLPF